jgi:uncharacterized membrane protein
MSALVPPPFAFGIVAVTFAATCTLAVALAVGLARTGRKLQGVLALVVLPIGVVLAFRAGLRRRAIAAALALAAYVAVRALFG